MRVIYGKIYAAPAPNCIIGSRIMTAVGLKKAD